VFRLFERLVAEGKTIVMVTHDPELATRVPRRLEIRDGRLVVDLSNGAGGVDRLPLEQGT
jgi:putative ABC transport system ATP-binding protein